MNFGKAIEALKQGKKVTRKGWNGKKMFLYYVPAGLYPARTEAAKSIADDGGKVHYGPYIAMKTAQGNVVPWLASQTDMLSEDWEVVGERDNQQQAKQPFEDCRMGNEIKTIAKDIESWAEADKENRAFILIATDKNLQDNEHEAQTVFQMQGDEGLNAFAITKILGTKECKQFKAMMATCLIMDRMVGGIFK